MLPVGCIRKAQGQAAVTYTQSFGWAGQVRDFLIYTSSGNAANVKQWFSSSDRNYDIWITNYTDTESLHKQYSDYYNESKGSKFQNLKAVFEKHRDLLAAYKAIMVADDDIIISPRSLSGLFNLLSDNDIWILQPAFSRFGKISHGITRRQLNTSLRYTNFIEVTCPIFRTDKLLEFLSVYRPELSLAYGVDWWFIHHLGKDRQDKFAISDTYYCINPRDFFKPGRCREIDSLCNQEQRLSMWEGIKAETGIDSFEQREFSQVRRSMFELIASYPAYLAEVLFSRAHARYTDIKRSLLKHSA